MSVGYRAPVEGRRLSRRTVLRAGLAGGAGVAAVGGTGVLVEGDVLPGRSRAYSLLGLNGEDAPIPDVAAGPRAGGSFVSAARGGVEVGWSVAYPPGSSPDEALPVLVALHAGRGDHETVFDGGLALDRFLAGAVLAGVPAFAVAAADGAGAWAPQPDGTDAGAMVVEELLPRLAARGLDTARVGFLGWSMGGYGALLLGATTGQAVRAVVATSPALPAAESPDALDLDPLRSAYRRIPLRVDVGRGDPFYHRVRDLREDLEPTPAGGVGAGGHTHGYWRRMAPAQLAFVGAHL